MFSYVHNTTTRIVTHGYIGNWKQIKIFISAFDADKAWVKELIIYKEVD